MPSPTANSWTCYRLRFRADSDICIGSQKLGFVQRTRYYIPGRNLWAAATANRAASTLPAETPRELLQQHYDQAGTAVGDALRFSPLFALTATDNRFIIPWTSTEENPALSHLDERQFERHYVGSRGRTAVNPDSASAHEGGLFDLEFLKSRPNGSPVEFGGYVWSAADSFSTAELHALLGEISVGGERRYGMGRLHLSAEPTPDTSPFGYLCAQGTPGLQLPERASVLGHLQMDGAPIGTQGAIEPLTGRIWNQNGAGQGHEPWTFCWAPGARLPAATTVSIGPRGIWTCTPASHPD